MDKGTAYTIEKIINNWNEEFPNFTLEPDDLKKPHLLMEALVQLFNRLGIVKDFIISPPPEELCSESISYYWDLLPVINVTRLVNHIVVDMPQVVSSISIMHFLQPTLSSSRSIIMLLFNLMLFNEQRLEEIAPHEEKLFAKSDHVRSLEARKNELLEMLNKQAEEKGIRAEKIEKLTVDIKQLEEESTLEKQGLSQVQLEVESILKEVRQTELLLEQKKFQRDTLMSEVARKKALRVYDADDIKTQAEQASQNVQEAEEKLNSFRSTLMLKENSLKNLQTIKPSLDSAINTLHEIMKLTDTLKDFESGDLDTESKEGELDLLNTELYELQVQLSELQAARAETVDKRQESQAHRQSEMAQALSSLHEAEEKDKKCRSRCKRSAQRTEEIKHLTLKYEQEKSAGIDELAAIKDSFCAGIKTMENSLIQKAKEVEKEAQQKLRNRNL